jgi:putative flippase GtrA
MTRLMMILYSIVGTTLMGIGIVVVLAAGIGTAQSIIIAAVVGGIVALPVSYLIAKQIAQD